MMIMMMIVVALVKYSNSKFFFELVLVAAKLLFITPSDIPTFYGIPLNCSEIVTLTRFLTTSVLYEVRVGDFAFHSFPYDMHQNLSVLAVEFLNDAREDVFGTPIISASPPSKIPANLVWVISFLKTLSPFPLNTHPNTQTFYIIRLPTRSRLRKENS